MLVGLGNPGHAYRDTRHNVGFEVLELLSRRAGSPTRRPRFQGETAQVSLRGAPVLLLWPLTWMNLSGSSVLAARLWDERKLAYPIKGHKKGVYWLTYFRMPGDGLIPLERQCEISDEILRNLVLRVDDQIADALVQHALSSGEASARRTTTPSPAAAAGAS